MNVRIIALIFISLNFIKVNAQQKEKAPKIVYKTEIKPLLAMNKIEEAIPLLNKYFKQNLIIGDIWNPKVMLLESTNMFDAEKTLAYHYDEKAFKEHSIVIADSAIFWFNRMLIDHHSDSTYAKNRIIFLSKSKNEFASIAHEKELAHTLEASNRQKMIADSLDNIRIAKDKREKFVKDSIEIAKVTREKFVKDSIEIAKIKNDELLKNKNVASTPVKTNDNVINTVKIGQQEWMSTDLKTTKYNNGKPIPEAKTDDQWNKYSENHEGCYRRLENNTIIYNGYAVFAITDNGGIIPSGFKIPTYNDFEKLYNFLGQGDSQSGSATKALASYPIDVEQWVGDEESGGLETVKIKTNNSSGFNATKGGFVYDYGSIGGEGSCSFWWTSTFEEYGYVIFDIGYCSQDAGGGNSIFPAAAGFALRLIKNQIMSKNNIEHLNGKYINKAGQKLIISNAKECCFDFDVTWGVNDNWGCLFSSNETATFKSSTEAYFGEDPEMSNIDFTIGNNKIIITAGYDFIGNDCSKFGDSNSKFYTEFLKQP
jgi:uncharacterized protein (TIGR02145 family)